MICRGVAVATILGAALSACALDTAGTIIGESTGSGAASASSAGGNGAAAGSGAASGAGAATSSSSTGPAVGGGGDATCGGGSVCMPPAESYALVLLEGAACPSGWQEPANLAVSSADPGCGACSCGAPAGGSCTPGMVGFSSDCNSYFEVGDQANCYNTSSNYNNVRADAPTAHGGSCPPSGGGKLPVEQRTVCRSASNGTCDQGSCVAAPADGELCLVAGDGPCPDGYPMRTLFPVTGDDRDCSCLCQPPGGQCQGAEVGVYSANDCSGTEAVIEADGSCDNPGNIGSLESWQFLTMGTWSGAGCQEDPQLGGPVTFGVGVVLCCAP
ncbi:MAG: hypothetical protein WKG00_33675 [Polyangiaceae bacterium]